MNIEVLHIVDCPSRGLAGDRLRDALNATGFGETPIRYRLLKSAQDAAAVPFTGSPTILLDGEDLFPGGARTTDLACRIHRTPAGLAGVPTTEQLTDAAASHGR